MTSILRSPLVSVTQLAFSSLAAVLFLASAAPGQTMSPIEAEQLARDCQERAGFSQRVVEERHVRAGDLEFGRRVETSPSARVEASLSKVGPFTVPRLKAELGGQCVGFGDAVEEFMKSRDAK